MLNLKAVCFSAMIILGGAHQSAHAAEPTIDQKIETLMRGIDSDRQRQGLFDQITNVLKTTLVGLPEPLAERMMSIINENYEQVFSDQKLATINIYKTVYSDEEINYMYDFYNTPIGNQILDKNTAFVDELYKYMTPKSVDFFQRAMMKIATDPELQKFAQKSRQNKQ